MIKNNIFDVSHFTDSYTAWLNLWREQSNVSIFNQTDVCVILSVFTGTII